MLHEPSRKNGRRVGAFDLLEKVGQGGMSTVYKARDSRSGEVVAVKVAARVVMNDPHLSRRFELEYAVAKPLKHPHLVKVLEFGVHDKIPFLVMEYVDGPSLGKYLKDHAKLSQHDAMPIVLQIAEALTYLHKKKIVHRDIKPANILLTADGTARLADLGLLKNLESMSKLTRSHMGLGTMHFASPEQFEEAREADVRSDVYSLAATLYAMLVGEPPFGIGGVVSVLQRKMKSEFEAPISKIPELSPAIDAAIRLALHCDRTQRPATCNEFVALLTGAAKVREGARLPGNVIAAAPKPKAVKKAESDRRSGRRYPTEFAASIRTVTDAQRWEATVRDLSITGACLLAKRRFETGNVLEITFPAAGADNSINRLARVRWIRATAARTWLLGCEFVNELAQDDLDSICTEWMAQTTHGKRA